MTIAIGRMNFILLAFGFMTQIGATELTSPCSVTTSGVDYVTTNPGPEVNNAACSLVGNDQIMMSKFVAGIISCFFLADRGRDSSFALDDEGFKQSLKDALKYFVRNREDLLSAFKEYCAIASGTMKITDAKMKISQTAEALRIIVDNQAF
ncbi:uncharacterized protein VICG_01767 [Vittaforma corneae ATCC 50505]|uniref:Uncharacterized protein n=1 Tax=Vittaforma corneae (strain ATCC 50505) TaxID=993615 RepID=L2GJW8_VITCO|nr:uncharacterized protein VICG_01767 [Vittaforma corneae ATCC 50505]ELA41168.1 hypothetical protein VICG_01767 [Vittaforma corneae ATCC 50505]